MFWSIVMTLSHWALHVRYVKQVFGHWCWARVQAALTFEKSQGVLRLTYAGPRRREGSGASAGRDAFFVGCLTGSESIGIASKHTQRADEHRRQFEIREPRALHD